MARMTKAEKAEYQSLLKQYDRLAKRADDRMRAIQAASYDRGMENIKSYAYAGAVKVIKQKYGGAERWRTKAPGTLKGLKMKMADIEFFLSRPTSTPSQIKRIYKKRAETFNKTLNEGLEPGEPRVNYTWQDMARFFESGAYQKLMERNFDSKTVFKRIYQQTRKKKQLDKFEARKIRGEIDGSKKDTVYANTAESIDSLLNDLGVKTEDFFV